MIDKDELAELMESERKEDARLEDLDCQDECKTERDDWDMSQSDYL